MHSSPTRPNHHTKTLLLLLLSAWMVLAQAQGFKQFYSFGRPNTIGTSVIPNGNNFVVSGVVTTNFFPKYSEVVWAKLDSVGGVVNFNPYGVNGLNLNSYFLSFIKDKQGNYLNTGYLDYAGFAATFLVKFNSLGDTIFFQKYLDSSSTYFGSFALIQHSDGNYYLTGNLDATNTYGSPSLLKIDNNGNLLIKKKYGTPWFEAGRSLMELPNKNILIGAYRSNNVIREDYQMEWSKTWLLEVDTGGSIVRQWLDSNDSTYYPTKLMLLSDSNFVYTAPYLFAWDSSPGVIFCSYFAKRDLNFNKIWEVKWGTRNELGPTSFDTTSSGDFIVVNDQNSDSTQIKGRCIVTKISSNGILLWQKEYFPLDTTHTSCYPHDIKVLPNGEIIIWAEVSASSGILNPIQQAWMLKIDSNGCPTSGCSTGWVEQDVVSEKIKLYPNPASSEFSLDIENPQMQGGNLDLYNIDGKKLSTTVNNFSHQTRVDISQFPNGIYLWRYTAPNLAVQSGKVVKLDARQ